MSQAAEDAPPRRAAADPMEKEKEQDEAQDAPPPTVSSVKPGDLPTLVFRFLSTATPGTLGGIAVGLTVVTYVLFGQLGLLLIGAFGGIVLFIQWEQRNAAVGRTVKGERGFDVLSRLLEAKSESRHGIAQGPDPNATIASGAPLHSFDNLPSETRQALNELIDAIITDYVKWWYTPIVPSDKIFPLACRRTLASFVLAIGSHLGRKRPADAFLDFLTNSSSIVIVFLSELSNAFAEVPTNPKAPVSEAIYKYLADKPDSNLANLLSQRQQEGKFRLVAEDLLAFLDPPTHECDAAKVFLREIMAGVVLEMTLQTCSKPEWINSWIVYLLEAGEPDLSQAIDVGMQTAPSPDPSFLDMDGNVGNVGVPRGNRTSLDVEKSSRKDFLTHKKKLSKADEELEFAMEEMKRMNDMIANAEAQRAKVSDDRKDNPRNQRSSADDAALSLGTMEKSLHRDGGSDGRSSKDGAVSTPDTPRSNEGSASHNSSPNARAEPRVKTFDHAVTKYPEEVGKPQQLLTLHNASITILDEPGDKGRIRNKPSWDYLIQIEPATTVHPGWMIARKYVDFEKLHEVLRRIAAVSGAIAFSEQHHELPSWKLHTRTSLRGELERYVRDACWFASLAESEGMKRFLEKELANRPVNKSGLQAVEQLGKNVFDAITSAPMEGGKVIVGGVTGVVGGVTGVLGNMGIGQKRTTIHASSPSTSALPPNLSLQDVTAASRLNMANPVNGTRKPRDSFDSQRSSILSLQPVKSVVMERRASCNSQDEPEPEMPKADGWERPAASARNSHEHSRASSVAPERSPMRTPSRLSLDGLKLPPPPDLITNDYDPVPSARQHLGPGAHSRSVPSPNLAQKGFEVPLRGKKQAAPLTEQETRVAVELLFAVINELYTLSSAWNIRRTLLAAAKSFLLRPGNPSLVSIQSLIQTSVLEANTSDAGIAAHLKKLRENTMPTDEERAAWPPELTDDEKEKLRVKARKLLIRSGVPAALMGVMGQSATSEALGRIFDSLQVEEVARGLMFGVMLQAVRTITH